MLKIGDIMTRNVFTLDAGSPAEDAARELSIRGYTGAPVRGPLGRLVGVLSRSDLTDPERRGDDGTLHAKEVQDLMTPAMFTLSQSESVLGAIKLMVREGIHRVIVMDENRDMVGIVTSTDVLGALARGELFADTSSSAAAGTFRKGPAVEAPASA
jgi:CBS domain-containing membrane protein